jgi:hypothetical protein
MRKIIALLSITLLPTLLAAQTKSTIQVAAPKPSAVCTSQLTPLTLKVGQGIPLPRTFSNPTSSSATFSITMQANSIFGPAHEVSRVTLTPGTGQTSSTPTIHPTGLRTPVGFARVAIIVTTNRTGGEVVGRCDYDLTMKAPPGVPGKIPRPIITAQSFSFLFQVPVRMCVIEGSALAAGKKPGETIAGKQVLDLLESVNKDIWFPNAQIAFSSAIESGFPVVADPSPPGQSCGLLGDLNAAGFAGGDGPFAETACAVAWQQLYPSKVGIPIIFARDFCNSGPITGGAQGPDSRLYVKSRKPLSGQRGDDLCGVPRRMAAFGNLSATFPSLYRLINCSLTSLALAALFIAFSPAVSRAQSCDSLVASGDTSGITDWSNITACLNNATTRPFWPARSILLNI